MTLNMFCLLYSSLKHHSLILSVYRSMVELSSTRLEDGSIEELIDRLCSTAGICDKDELTFKDFSKVLDDYQSVISCAVLDFNINGRH